MARAGDSGRAVMAQAGVPLILLLLFLLHAVANGIWLYQDLNLEAGDTRVQLAAQAQAYNIVAEQPLSGLLRLVRAPAAGLWPSAGYLPWIVGAGLVGQGLFTVRMLNLIFLGILLLGVYKLGRWLHSRETGLVAAALVSFYPIIWGQSRQFGMDLPRQPCSPCCIGRWSPPGACPTPTVASGSA